MTVAALKNPTYVELCNLRRIECVVIETTRDDSMTYLTLKNPTYVE